MLPPSTLLRTLATELLTPAEHATFQHLFTETPFAYHQLIAFDMQLGGPGFSNVDSSGSRRYHICDRAIFRPLQYCAMYFELAYEGSNATWLTRALVQMSSLHIEELVKRRVGDPPFPLGRVLRDPQVRRTLDTVTWHHIDRFTRVYNAAKHTVDHPKDTHLFPIEDALLAYVIARKLAALLYPHIRLFTDLTIFLQSGSS